MRASHPQLRSLHFLRDALLKLKSGAGLNRPRNGRMPYPPQQWPPKEVERECHGCAVDRLKSVGKKGKGFANQSEASNGVSAKMLR
jgi:hypothetical protein